MTKKTVSVLGEQDFAKPPGGHGAVFSAAGASGAATETKKPRILIVEDDFLVSSAIEVALTQAGFEVAGIASSADEALELALSQKPDLAIMDIRLSGARDGVDAAMELFKTHGIRSVFATAHHDAEAKDRARPAQPLAWVPKPYTMTSLVAAVQQALGGADGG
jgi:two-component system, response regulator PdtaR